MTNQKAIKILGQYDVSDLHFYTTDGEEIPFTEWSDAIEMAISALERQEAKNSSQELKNSNESSLTQNALDTINRRDAIDALTDKNIIEHMDSVCDSELHRFKRATERIIAQLPSAQTESCEYYALCRHGRDENKLRLALGCCDYCTEDSDGYVKPVEKNCHAFIRFGMDGWELSLKANGWHGSAKIKYCPMCGRELKNDK